MKMGFGLKQKGGPSESHAVRLVRGLGVIAHMDPLFFSEAGGGLFFLKALTAQCGTITYTYPYILLGGFRLICPTRIQIC